MTQQEHYEEQVAALSKFSALRFVEESDHGPTLRPDHADELRGMLNALWEGAGIAAAKDAAAVAAEHR